MSVLFEWNEKVQYKQSVFELEIDRYQRLLLELHCTPLLKQGVGDVITGRIEQVGAAEQGWLKFGDFETHVIFKAA